MTEPCNKPYEIVGAGQLTATVWKIGDEASGWSYHFNLFRQCRRSGFVSQVYRPRDVGDLVKLARVLALTLADDGCLSAAERRSLAQLADRLEPVTGSEG